MQKKSMKKGAAVGNRAAIWSRAAVWSVENTVTGLEILVNGEIASGYVGKRAGLRAILEETAAEIKDFGALRGSADESLTEPAVEFASGALVVKLREPGFRHN